MKKDQLDSLCNILRIYTRMRTDCILMTAILDEAELRGRVPLDWRDELARLRELPAHREAREETEWLVSQARRTADEDALMKLISHIPKSTLPD